jgi:energy-coupling factor transport system ATP-binding protein
MIPLTIFFGAYYLGDRKYYFIALLILLETMLPFALVVESRKPQARELVGIAALCAIGVAGRAAFFMLPEFKPVVAFVVISGVAIGAETGVLGGAMTRLVSNIMFGQGPWTPWQMFTMGIVGFWRASCSARASSGARVCPCACSARLPPSSSTAAS